ncbi:MAG: N-methyl-L-tryptophan oxidase [Chloroflexi bacterium]|nr:N-methyl-L-tryptophan oxidase [Chloroflexota bacterium]
MQTHYDIIVLGCGGIGSAALYWLSRRSRGVLGVEQFEIGHSKGGSQDHSRIIRLTYESDEYTRLTPHSYTAWATVEAESGLKLVHKTGGLAMALRNGPHQQYIEDCAASMTRCRIPFERLTADETMKRYPQWRFDEEVDVLYQADMGLVDAAKGNAAHIGLARSRGATILDHCPVIAIRSSGSGAEVVTAQGAFSCGHLILTAGGWTDKVLASLGLNLGIAVTQEQVTYYATPNLKEFSMERFPTFMWEGDPYAYGFPVYGEVATKLGMDAAGPIVDPDRRDYLPDPKRELRSGQFLRRYCPGFLGPILFTKTCQYDMPRDRNFILDALPGHPQISVFVGAGHAYKFASLAGKILSELALDGRATHDLSAFRINRPAVTDPNYPLAFANTITK